jgi:hypothetical protein
MTAASATNGIHGNLTMLLVKQRFDALKARWVVRIEHPRLAFIAIPLAMNASGLVERWWLWPPLLVGTAASTRQWRWGLALTCQFAVLGTEWAYVGAMSLAHWRSERLLVGIVWVGCALCLAGAAQFHPHNRDVLAQGAKGLRAVPTRNRM